MAKLLKYDAPQVRQEGIPSVRFNVDPGNGAEALGQGVRRLGAGLERVAGEELAAKQAAADESDRAISALVTGAETSLDKTMTDVLDDDEKGFFRLEGESALGRDTEALDTLEKRRMEILEKELQHPKAKMIFDARSKGMIENARRRMEIHLGRQRDVIAEANLGAAEATSLDALSRGDVYKTPEARAFQIARPEASLRALSKTREQGEARVQAWRKKADKVILDKYIKAGDAEGAEAYFLQARERLGADAAEVESRIKGELTALKGYRTAATIAKDSVNAGGWIDSAIARQKLAEMPEGTSEEIALKKQAKAHLDELVTRSDDNRKRAGEGMLNELRSISRLQGTINTPRARDIQRWMLKPENQAAGLLDGFLDGLERKQRARANDAGAQREQKKLNRRWLANFDWRDDDVQINTDVEAVYGDLVDEETIEKMKKIQKMARESKERGLRISGSEAKAAAKDDIATKPILQNSDEDVQASYTHQLTDWARAFEAEHRRPPSQTELQDARDKALLSIVKERMILPDQEVPAFTKTGINVPAPKPVEGLKRSDVVPTAPPKTRLPLNERVKQLKAQGLSKEQGLEILKSEGYQ